LIGKEREFFVNLKKCGLWRKDGFGVEVGSLDIVRF
jgi:hypothetical protein